MIQTIKAKIVIDTSIPPHTELRYTGPRLVVFQPVTTIEIHRLILSTPNKSCDLNPIPTTLVNQCCADLLPIITNTCIINGSLVSGVFPSDYKVALVRPIITRCTRGDARSFFCTHKTYLYAHNEISYKYIQILF